MLFRSEYWDVEKVMYKPANSAGWYTGYEGMDNGYKWYNKRVLKTRQVKKVVPCEYSENTTSGSDDCVHWIYDYFPRPQPELVGYTKGNIFRRGRPVYSNWYKGKYLAPCSVPQPEIENPEKLPETREPKWSDGIVRNVGVVIVAGSSGGYYSNRQGPVSPGGPVHTGGLGGPVYNGGGYGPVYNGGLH